MHEYQNSTKDVSARDLWINAFNGFDNVNAESIHSIFGSWLKSVDLRMLAGTGSIEWDKITGHQTPLYDGMASR